MDRLNELHQFTSTNPLTNSPYHKLEPDDGFIISDNDDLKHIKDLDQKIRTKNNEIVKDINYMNESINKLIGSVDDKDNKIKKEIDTLTQDINSKMIATKSLIDKLKTEKKKFVNNKDNKDNKDNSNNVKLRVIDNLITFNMNKFSETGKLCADVKNSYEEKLRSKIKRQLNIVDQEKYQSITDAEVDIMIQEGRTKVFTREIFSDIQERHHQILELEKSIVELHQLFVDMAVLVEAQGEIIDTIEDNVIKTDAYIEKGKNELVDANTYQKRIRKKKCFLIVCCAVIVGIILFVVTSSFKSNK